MLNLTAFMEEALAPRIAGQTLVRYPALLYEVYQPDHFPATGAMFDPADAIERFSEVSIVWLGHSYQKLVLSRGSIGKHITGEFNGCSVTFSNVGPDNSKPMSAFVLSNEISGLRLVIRYVDIERSHTLADSAILYVGRLRDPDTTSDEECVIPSKEEMGSILHEIPRRVFSPDDPLGREANDPLFEGIRSSTRTGISYYTEAVTKRTWGFLWRVTRDEMRTNQFSAENDGHLGDAMPWINGRCQMEGIPIAWVDEGKTVRGLYVFAGSKVDAIENIQCLTEGFRLQSPPDGPPTTIIALGDPGGTLTNAAMDPSFLELGFLSNTAYVVAHFLGSEVTNIDPAPTLSALVFGYGDLPDESGNFTIKGRSDNPAIIARRIFTDQQGLGMNPGLINDASFIRTSYLCDQYIKDETNSELLAAHPDLIAAMETGEVTRFESGAVVNSSWHRYNLDLALTRAGGEPRVPIIHDPRETPLDPSDPIPVEPGTAPVTPDTRLIFRRRFTFNAPLTDKMKAVDFLHNLLYQSARLYDKTGQDGRISLDMERPASSAFLALPANPGQNQITVLDIEPWRISLKGKILIGAGLITSEVRKVTGVEYDPAVGNSITISVAGAGSTTLALEVGGPTFVGGTTTVAAGATIVVGGTASPPQKVSVTIDGRTVSWEMDGVDDPQTIAASVAMIINADKEFEDYILALWDGDVRVRVTSKIGKIFVDAVLAESHDVQQESPTVAPIASVLSGGNLVEGVYNLAYSWQDPLGETFISPQLQVTTTATNKRIQTGALVMPTGVASVNWYLSLSPTDSTLRYIGNADSGAPYTISDPPISSSRRIPQLNDTGEEIIRVLFDWGPENIREGTKVQWPLAARDDAINQVYIEFISAVDDFKTTQLTINDYIHQQRTGAVNRFEVNGRGIDNYDQAVRIANAVLAFKRDGNFSVSWTTDEAGLPYEVGDVGCITDDSGLINQPVRIEHLSIEANNDVAFEARIYSTHMMKDLTGQKEIAISSPLKYIGAAPPPVSNVDIMELPPVASGNIWVSRVHVTFDFAPYRGTQLAHIYVKVFGDDEYHVVDVINPSLENTGVFDISGLPRTDPGSPHLLKIVAESAYGKTEGLEAAVEYPIELLPPAISVFKIFDNVAPRDAFIDIMGLTIGVNRQGMAPETWYGSDIWRDRGYGPDPIAILRNGSTMGHTIDGGTGWLSISGDEVWVQKECGLLFQNATDAQIFAGQNNYFVGREKLGVHTWVETPVDSGNWKGTGLVRGLNHTEIFQASHIGSEDWILLDENIYFLPCIEPRDVDHAVDFKAVTIMQNFADGTNVHIPIVRGDSYRPYAVSSPEGYGDSSNDFHFTFLGNETPGQTPATWFVEIYSDSSYTVMKRRLPVVIGTVTACSLLGTEVGEDGVVKNSLYCDTDGPVYATTLQAIRKTYSRFDFNFRWLGTDHALLMPITFHKFIYTAFQGALDRDPTPAENTAWNDALTLAYTGGPPSNEAVLLAECKLLLNNLFHTAEYGLTSKDNDVFVNDCYQAYLGRNSEPAGHAFWLNDVVVNGKDHTLTAFGESIEFLTEIVRVLEPGSFEDASRVIQVSLETKDDLIAGPQVEANCPITLSWEAAVMIGAVAERVLNYDKAIFEEAAFSDLRNQVDPGYSVSKAARHVSGRAGPRYTLYLSGTEYRIYEGFIAGSGQKPLARCSAPSPTTEFPDGFPFPLRLSLTVKDTTTGLLCIENVTIAGDLQPSTIYSSDQQAGNPIGSGGDFGALQSTVYAKIYQQGKYFNLQGFPIFLTVTL